MAQQIQIRRDGSADWVTANPVLGQGEMGLELDTVQVKFGDGGTAWNDLPYFSPTDAPLAWGTIIGTLSDQTDLQIALDLKQDAIADSDDIAQGSVNLFLTTAERTKLGNTSGVNTGDQDLSAYALLTALDLKANLSGATFTGTISATNLSGTNTGDQDLSAYALITSLATKLSLDGGVMTGPLSGYVGDINDQTGTTYILQSSDRGKIVTLNNASDITLTVPAGSGLGAGFNCTIMQLGVGQVTVVGSGTTINNFDGHTKLAGQWAMGVIFSYATNLFTFSGRTA